jgi:hypothetical protein
MSNWSKETLSKLTELSVAQAEKKLELEKARKDRERLDAEVSKAYQVEREVTNELRQAINDLYDFVRGLGRPQGEKNE